MEFRICLAKKIIIFYVFLSPFIIIGSIYNLIGFLNHTSSIVVLGAFGLFGFILLPVALITTFLRNICSIKAGRVRIGKIEYKFSNYSFYTTEYEIPFNDRPITSIFRKKYHKLVIKKIETQEIVSEENLEVFRKDIEKIRHALLKFGAI